MSSKIWALWHTIYIFYMFHIILYYIMLYTTLRHVILYYIIVIVEERVEKENGLFAAVTLRFFLYSVSKCWQMNAPGPFEASRTTDTATQHQTSNPMNPHNHSFVCSTTLWRLYVYMIFCNKEGHAYRPTQLTYVIQSIVAKCFGLIQLYSGHRSAAHKCIRW